MNCLDQKFVEETARAVYRAFVVEHLLHHGFFHVGVEMKFCGCEVARAYRRKFSIPEPNPEWYPDDWSAA